jgi:hypothetical protein
MPAHDVGFKIVARAAGQHLAALAGVASDQWTPIVSEMQTAERLADRVFLARFGRKRFLVYMEAYTYWTTAAPWSILSKSGLLSERERLPTVSVVYILRPRAYRAQGGQFRLATPEGPTQQVWFREVFFWQVQPEPWWDEVPGLMALSPLCRRQGTLGDVVGRAVQAITAHTPDTLQRADLLTTLGIFGKLTYPALDVFQVIGRRQLQESKFYQEIQEEARVEKGREDILQALDAKFGRAAAAEFGPILETVTDGDRLDKLLRLAAKSSRLKEFRDRYQET